MLWTFTRGQEALDNFHASSDFLLNLLRAGRTKLIAQTFDSRSQIHLLQQLLKRFRAHASLESVRTMLLNRFTVGIFVQKFFLLHARLTRVDHEILLIVNHLLQLTCGHIQHQRETAGHALEEPNMRYRNRHTDVTHALTTNARNSHFDAALITNDILVLNFLILSAIALVITDRSENTLAEKAIGLGFKRTIINRLRAFHFLKAFDLTVAVFIQFVEELLARPSNNLFG